jgi:hypothetical protein
MKRLLQILILVYASGGAGTAHGFIDPKFTPVQLVKESQAIFTGTTAADAKGRHRITAVEVLKGKPAGPVMSLAAPQDDSVKAMAGILSSNGDQTVIVFTSQDGKTARLHASGVWFQLPASDGGVWQVGLARQMSGVWAGGTDMLIRLCRYLLADPRGTVPVSVGISWMRDKATLGKVEGRIAGLQAIEVGADHAACVFVASDKGDRLYRANKDDETFQDVTSKMGLDSRSRQFCWTDLDGSGAAQLVSWDGAAIQVRQLRDGKFGLVGKDYPARGGCLALAACAVGKCEPAVLVTTSDIPVLLRRDRDGAWQSTLLRSGDPVKGAGEVTCACIEADFDNDGYVDIVQPRSKAGLLWKGGPDGFSPPQAFAFACAEAPARFCLGDYDGDGSLDIFISGPKANELWTNDGKRGFQPVISSGGSLSYRCAPAASFCGAVDLNHDGRADLCMMYAKAEFSYHFNRGFRCFGEEGELRLVAPEGTPADVGQVGACVWDFNGDGALDLTTAFADGRIVCYYNDAFNKPMLRVSLKKGLVGPVTFSVWQGPNAAECLGTFTAGAVPVPVPLREAGDCVIKYILPDKPVLTKTVAWPVKVPATGIDVLLD